MAQWKATVNIKKVMHRQEKTTEALKAMMNEMAALIESNQCFVDFDRGYLDEMKDLPDEPYEVLVESVDDLLYEIYEYADAERIWLGI